MASKKPAAWSTQVDNEEDGTGETELTPLPAAFAASAELYPSLGDAAKVVETKAEKKKKQAKNKMSLADFKRQGPLISNDAGGRLHAGHPGSCSLILFFVWCDLRMILFNLDHRISCRASSTMSLECESHSAAVPPQHGEGYRQQFRHVQRIQCQGALCRQGCRCKAGQLTAGPTHGPRSY